MKKPKLRGDSYCAFFQLIDYCVANGCPLCLAGDLFDSDRPSPMDLNAFIEGMLRMKAAGLAVYYIQGQHEFQLLSWAQAAHVDVRYVHRTVFEPVPGFKVYGLNNMSGDELQHELGDMPAGVEAVMLHQWERSCFPISGSWNFDVAWLPPGIKLVMLGDYHKRIDLLYGTGMGFYTGSQHLMDLGEDCNKSFCVVTVDDGPAGNVVGYERVELASRPYFFKKVMTEEELAAATTWLSGLDPHAFDALPEDIRKPIVVLEYMTSLENSGPRILTAAGDKVHLFPKPVNMQYANWAATASRGVVDGDLLTLSSCVHTVAAEGSDQYGFITDLVTKPGTSDVFAYWREKYGVS